MAPTHRRSYSAALKRNVMLYADSTNILSAEREFGVLEKCVRFWRQQRDKLLPCTGLQKLFREPTEGKYPAIEEAVHKWVCEQREKNLACLMRTFR